jgi:hypothetical protein
MTRWGLPFPRTRRETVIEHPPQDAALPGTRHALDVPVRAAPPASSQAAAQVRTACLPIRSSEANLQQEDASRKTTGRRLLAWARKLFIDPKAVMLSDLKAAVATAGRFGMQVEKVFHQPIDAGVCMRTSVKWAACRLVGAPFRFSKLNMERTRAKQADYERAFQSSLDAMKGVIDAQEVEVAPDARQRLLARAVLEGTARVLTGWADRFTDAKGVKHCNRLHVGRPQPNCDLAQMLHAASSSEDKALIVCIDRLESGHTVAVCGGREPRVFDTAVGELRYRGTNFGGDLLGYLEALHKGPGHDALTFHVIPLHVRST